MRVGLTVGVQSGSMTEAVTFSLLRLTGFLAGNWSSSESWANFTLSVHPSNRPSTGSSSVTLVGSGLGHASYTSSARSSSTSCVASQWVSDTAMVCRMSSGLRGTLRVGITAGVDVGTTTEALSFTSPAVS
eukprot:736043-Rhodomonas_salina.1